MVEKDSVKATISTRAQQEQMQTHALIEEHVIPALQLEDRHPDNATYAFNSKFITPCTLSSQNQVRQFHTGKPTRN